MCFIINLEYAYHKLRSLETQITGIILQKKQHNCINFLNVVHVFSQVQKKPNRPKST